MRDPADLLARRDAVVAAHGPWIGYNIDLGDSLSTMAPGHLLHRLRRITKLFTIVETQISLSDRTSLTHAGHTYRGRPSPEVTSRPGAAVDVANAFWLTRPSLLNLLADAGYTSVLDCANPVITSLAAFRDHVTLVAAAGERVDYLDLPDQRWPERIPPVAAPNQGLRWALMERYRRRRGGGMDSAFVKRPRA